MTDLLEVTGHGGGGDEWGGSSGEEDMIKKKPLVNCFAAPRKRKVRFNVPEGEEEETDSDLDDMFDNDDETMDEESFETFKEIEDDSEAEDKDKAESEPEIPTKYVPPQKRDISQKLHKNVQGLINR